MLKLNIKKEFMYKILTPISASGIGVGSAYATLSLLNNFNITGFLIGLVILLVSFPAFLFTWDKAFNL